MEPKYRFTLSEDALGVVVDLHGPGLPRFANGVHLLQSTNEWAEKVLTEDGTYWATDVTPTPPASRPARKNSVCCSE